jgi:lactobin A/cerein 7B family class IIb bacteriocin
MHEFEFINDQELAHIDGGFPPAIVAGAWLILGGTSFCAGWMVGESVGNSLNKD